MTRTIGKEGNDMLLELSNTKVTSDTLEPIPKFLQCLTQEFEGIFQEPSGLPPP